MVKLFAGGQWVRGSSLSTWISEIGYFPLFKLRHHRKKILKTTQPNLNMAALICDRLTYFWIICNCWTHLINLSWSMYQTSSTNFFPRADPLKNVRLSLLFTIPQGGGGGGGGGGLKYERRRVSHFKILQVQCTWHKYRAMTPKNHHGVANFRLGCYYIIINLCLRVLFIF